MKQNSYKSIALSLGTALLLGMSGCSDSNDSNDNNGGSGGSSDTSISGKAVDGYLSQATVCLDLNNDGYCQIGDEPASYTKEDGTFSLSLTATQKSAYPEYTKAPLLIYSGFDIDTGVDFTGKLKANLGDGNAVNVSPISTMVKSIIDSGKAEAEANTLVKEMLDLPADVDLGADPVEEAKKDPKLLKAALKLQKVVEVLAAAKKEAGETKSEHAVAADLYVKLAKQAVDKSATLDKAVENVVANDAQLDSDAQKSATAISGQIELLIDDDTGVANTAVIGTKIGAVKEKIVVAIETNSGVPTESELKTITTKSFAQLHAEEILRIVDVEDTNNLSAEVARVLKAAGMTEEAFLPIESEVKALMSDAKTYSVGVKFENYRNDALEVERKKLEIEAEVAKEKAEYEAKIAAEADAEQKKILEDAQAAAEAKAKAEAEKIAADAEAARLKALEDALKKAQDEQLFDTADLEKLAEEALKVTAEKEKAEAEAALKSEKLKVTTEVYSEIATITEKLSSSNTKITEAAKEIESAAKNNDAAATAFLEDIKKLNLVAVNEDVALLLGEITTSLENIEKTEDIVTVKSEATKITSNIDQLKEKLESIEKSESVIEGYVATLELNKPNENVVKALALLDSIDPAKDSLTETVEKMKGMLGTGSQDELVLSAMIDIVEVANSATVKNLINVENNLPNLDAFTGDKEAVITLASTATTEGGTAALHELAEKLRNASNVIGDAFENSAKVMYYQNQTIGINEALMARAGALSAAAALDIAASYSYGDISYFKKQSKEIDGVTYEYVTIDVDELALFKQSDFFKMNNTDRLVAAGEDLKTAAELFTQLDPTYAKENSTDTTDAQNFLAAYNGDGKYMQADGTVIDLKKLFSTTDYIDRNDFDIPSSYLGYSSDVLAEYKKAAAGYVAMQDYVKDGCSGDAPTNNIDWNLLESSDRNVSVQIDTDLSIVHGEPTYTESKPVYFDAIHSDICEFHGYESSDYGRAEFEFEPNAGFKNVIIPVKLADKFVAGTTLYTHKYDGDNIYYKIELSESKGIKYTELGYYPDENGNLVEFKNIYKGRYEINENDQAVISTENVENDADKQNFAFELKDSDEDGLELEIGGNTKYYNYTKPDWFPKDL